MPKPEKVKEADPRRVGAAASFTRKDRASCSFPRRDRLPPQSGLGRVRLRIRAVRLAREQGIEGACRAVRRNSRYIPEEHPESRDTPRRNICGPAAPTHRLTVARTSSLTEQDHIRE